MKYIQRYIFVLSLVSLMVSCGLDEPFEPQEQGHVSRQVELIARPTNFIRTNVATKATDPEIDAIENAVHTAYFLMYDSNGRLLRYENLTKDITDKSETLSQNIVTDKGMTGVTVCFAANLPEAFVKDHMTSNDATVTDLAKFKSAVIQFNNTSDTRFKIEKPSTTGLVGVPSIDVYGNRNHVNCLPMLGVWTGDLNAATGPAIEVPVKRLFAKIAFTITLDITDGSEFEEPAPTLDLNSMVVKNIPKQVSLFPQESEGSLPLNGATSDFLGTSYSQISLLDNIKIQNTESTSFFFYVPEYIVEPVLEGNDQQGWYKQGLQQYKPQLIKVDSRTSKKATYLELEGILSKQGQDLQMTYQIYLGENNFDSFSMKRNYLLDNYVTINGVSEGDGSIGVDHRVEVEYAGFLVGFQRATLLDSHFEVRPLRVKFSQDFIRENNKKTIPDGDLTVEILPDDNGDVPGWLRLERPSIFTDDPIYCLGGDTKYSHTKRRYFTTDLIETLGEEGKSVSYNPFATLKNGGDKDGDVPVWVYVDEYTAASASEYKSDDDEDHVRRAKIRVSYTPYDGGEVISQEFTVQQRAIYPIATVGWDGQSRTYGIEYFEEYLHNYDTQDNYGVEGGEYFTSESGITWGFDGIQISNTDKALYYTDDGGRIDIDGFINYLNLGEGLYYDFYLNRDKDSDDDDITLHDYSGYEFNQKIISKEGLHNIDRHLNDTTQSAIEYCLNKNKRNKDGYVVYTYILPEVPNEEITEDVTYYRKKRSVFYDYYKLTLYYRNTTYYTYTYLSTNNFKWFVPAVDELEDIVTFGMGHEFFSEVFVDNLYWSSQPAYDRNFSDIVLGSSVLSQRTSGAYMSDNVSAARATKFDVSSNTFVSSDISGETKEEGYLYAKTFYGMNINDMDYVSYPNETNGVFVKKLILTNLRGTEYKFEDEVVAVTNYKKIDGVTDIQLPEGIQPRTSKHRVRCIYNPTPLDDQLVSTTTRVVNETEPYRIVLEARKNGYSRPSGWENGTTITDEGQIAYIDDPRTEKIGF